MFNETYENCYFSNDGQKEYCCLLCAGALGWFCSVIVECCVSIDEQLNPF